jgi:hypothetical protein
MAPYPTSMLLVCFCMSAVAWMCRGIPAAVKVMQLPVFEDEAVLGAHARSPTGGAGLAAAAVAERRRRGGINRREQMAVMEAALGSSLSHPNILQVGSARGCGVTGIFHFGHRRRVDLFTDQVSNPSLAPAEPLLCNHQLVSGIVHWCRTA